MGSEDSDYKSDLGAPNQHQFNQSSHQFSSHLHPTTRSSYNTSSLGHSNGTNYDAFNSRIEEGEDLSHEESHLRSASGSFQPYTNDYAAYNSVSAFHFATPLILTGFLWHGLNNELH